MKLGFYPKLAWTGMRSNRKLYLPYLITCISMVAMLYIVGYLSGAEAVRHLPGGQFIQESLGLGVWIIALFAGLFLVYSSSFLRPAGELPCRQRRRGHRRRGGGNGQYRALRRGAAKNDLGGTAMNKYLDIAPEVREALQAGKPVVALESTIISHGMPYPQNVETALNVERIVRENGAVPATIAILGGRLKAGLSKEEIEYLGKTGTAVTKVSRRDLPVVVSRGMDGATTVATTMIVAAMAGIRVFATGGIGGVHRGAETTMDISADLEELAMTPVMVVCAGAKSILDLGLTLEYLETKGVPVIGYQTGELPAFYTRTSGFKVDYRLDSPEELAAAFHAKGEMGLKGGMLVTNPIPEQYSMDADKINAVIDRAVEESRALGIHGKETTPYLLAKIKDITGGDSLAANIQLVYNNAALAARTAAALSALG